MEFDRKTLREKCGDEGLLHAKLPSSKIYGVKTFEHALDRLEDRCASVLNLVSEFDARFIRDAGAWNASLQPQLLVRCCLVYDVCLSQGRTFRRARASSFPAHTRTISPRRWQTGSRAIERAMPSFSWSASTYLPLPLMLLRFS
jgi:hypothetical protein